MKDMKIMILQVSIHAPARGATITVHIVNIKTKKFQSTHPRGVRRLKLIKPNNITGCFNPRTREGCDQETITDHVYGILVSIHAPARGATLNICRIPLCIQCFNPRTREGCDLTTLFHPIATCVSIHAPARGATLSSQPSPSSSMVSIHAPARGATVPLILSKIAQACFNPRTREGCDARP